MNKVILIGRLTKEPEIRQSQSGTVVARYTLAVARPYKSKDGDTDFINCIAFNKKAEFAQKYLSKGMKIAITGSIQTGSYDKDGKKVYTTEVVISEQEFVESKGTNSASAQASHFDGFMNIPDDIDEYLPFN